MPTATPHKRRGARCRPRRRASVRPCRHRNDVRATVSDPPMTSSTVTFLFTDIEGSTRLWEAQPTLMRKSLARHDDLVREAIVASGGHVFKTVGDAFCAAFAHASGALDAAIAVQLALANEPWPETTPIKVRIALHTGEVEATDADYLGPPLNRVARLLATGHGGQTILSHATRESVRGATPDATTLRDLGIHRLKDLAQPEHVYRARAPDSLGGPFPPLAVAFHAPEQSAAPAHRLHRARKRPPRDRIAVGSTRLLTLTGPGGSGKTRLSPPARGRACSRSFRTECGSTELAAVAGSDLVAQAVATALAVKEAPGQPMAETLVKHLGAKRLLLVLDNCEHLVADCAAARAYLAVSMPCAAHRSRRAARRSLVAGERDVPSTRHCRYPTSATRRRPPRSPAASPSSSSSIARCSVRPGFAVTPRECARRWPRSAASSKASRWRSSSLRRGCARSPWRKSTLGSAADSIC